MSLHLRFEDVVLVRAHQGFRTLSARRRADGARVTLIAPHRFDEPTVVRRALERAADAHARIEHPGVPRTVELHEIDGRPVLELDCPVVADAIEVARRLAASRVRLPYAAADAYIVGIRLALEAAHRVSDSSGGPLCIGRLSAANVLFSADGRWFVLGFGHNLSVDDAHGVPDAAIPYVSAPEVMLGHPATPEGDYAALIQLMRTGIAMVDKTDALGRILDGLRSSSDQLLVELVQWFDQRVIGEQPHRRPTIAEAVAQSDRIRTLLGVTPDARGMAAMVARLLADTKVDEPLRVPPGGAILSLGEGGEWARWNEDEPIRLRGPMRRMLVALAEKQQLGSPSAMRASDFIDVGWPDESPSHESALNRIYVTLNRLKKSLPEGLIERFDDGYRLRPGIVVRRAASA